MFQRCNLTEYNPNWYHDLRHFWTMAFLYLDSTAHYEHTDSMLLSAWCMPFSNPYRQTSETDAGMHGKLTQAYVIPKYYVGIT